VRLATTSNSHHSCEVCIWFPLCRTRQWRRVIEPEQLKIGTSLSPSLHRAVLAGHRVSMVPEALIVDDIRAARLYRLLPKYKSGRRPTFVLYPSRRHLAPRTRVVIDFLVEQVSEAAARLAQDDVWGDSDTTWLV